MLHRTFCFFFCFLALIGCTTKPQVTLKKSTFSSLKNWENDNYSEALETFKKSCSINKHIISADIFAKVNKQILSTEWQKTCNSAKKSNKAKEFFEKNFTPFRVRSNKGDKGLFTGYYEVELEGSLKKTKKYTHPIYSHSNKINQKIPRSKIEKGAIDNKKLEIAFVSDRVKLFFMHIQGSGKIKVDNKSYIKLGYAGQNGHPYFPIGKYLSEHNYIDKKNINAESIINWLNANPHLASKVMHLNESYVFFKNRKEHHPVGAMGVEVTAMRTLAVDKKFIPLGSLLWLETNYPIIDKNKPTQNFNRIMVAQDVGGAIKGPIRGDIFFGSDKTAEKFAWYMKNYGIYYLLIPNNIARYLND